MILTAPRKSCGILQVWLQTTKRSNRFSVTKKLAAVN
jgi:hypothetical protein